MNRCVRIIALAAALAGFAPEAASAERAVGLTGVRTLVQFDTAAPSVTTTRLISGLQDQDNENLMGLDVRAATGELYLFTGTGSGISTLLRTYKVDPATAAATFVGSSGTPQGGNGPNNDQLVMVGGVDGSPSANNGQVTPVGPLGVNLNDQDVGFDISPSGTAY